jgi:hypothetical protein
MAYQTLFVTPDDGEKYELKVTSRDALMWERSGRDNPSILDYLQRPSMSEAYRLGHIVAKRTQQFMGTLKEFEQSNDLVIGMGIDTDDEPDPTESAASADD